MSMMASTTISSEKQISIVKKRGSSAAKSAATLKALPKTKVESTLEPSNVPVSRRMPRSLPKIGLNHLIIVSWEKKQQVYCLLCSVRVKTSTHSYSITHCCNYVKMKYPRWTTYLSDLDATLQDIVVPLAEIEKSIGPQKPQRIEVQKELYLKLAVFSEREALQELTALVKQNSQDPSSMTEIVDEAQDQAETPGEVSSSDDKTFKQGPSTTHVQLLCDATSLLPKIEIKAEPLFTPELHKKTVSPSQDAPKAVDCCPEDKIYNPKKAASPAQMRQNELNHTAKKAAKDGKALANTTEFPSTSITRVTSGRKAPGCSNLSLYLSVSRENTKQVIGIDSVWECRGICLETFFLCESCEETISRRDICKHMVSLDHKVKYMWKNHAELLQIFWLEEDLPQSLKMEIFHDVIRKLAKRDHFFKTDAKCTILEGWLHQYVRTAQFSDALKIVQNILKEEQKSRVHQPFSAERPPNAVNTKKTIFEEMNVVGTSDIVPKRNFHLMDMNSSSSKTDLVGSPVPNPRVNFATDTKPGPFLKQEWTTAVSQAQSSGQKPFSDSASCTAVRKNLNKSIRGRTRKRPADTSDQTLHTTSSPLTDPLPAEPAHIKQKIKSEPASPTQSPPYNLSPGPSLLAVKDEGAGHEQVKSTGDEGICSKLTSLSKPSTFKKRNLSKAAKDVKTINSRETSSLEMAQTRWDSKINIKSESVSQTCDSKSYLIQSTVKKNPPSNSEKDEVALFEGAYRKPVLTGIPSASASPKDKPIHGPGPTAARRGPHDLHVGAQRICRSVSGLPSSCAPTDPNSGSVPQPKHKPEPDRTGISQLRINSVRSDQSNPIKPMFQDKYKTLVHTDINRDHAVSFHTYPPPRPSHTVAAPGGCNAFIQAACGPRGNPGPLSPWVNSIQKQQMDASVSNEGSHQQYICSSPIFPQPMINPFRVSPFRYNVMSPLPPGVRVSPLPCYSFIEQKCETCSDVY